MGREVQWRLRCCYRPQIQVKTVYLRRATQTFDLSVSRTDVLVDLKRRTVFPTIQPIVWQERLRENYEFNGVGSDRNRDVPFNPFNMNKWWMRNIVINHDNPRNFMAVVPTLGLNQTWLDLTPPIGAKGFPLTLVYSDSFTSMTDAPRQAMFDQQPNSFGPMKPSTLGSGISLNAWGSSPSTFASNNGVMYGNVNQPLATVLIVSHHNLVDWHWCSRLRINFETGAIEVPNREQFKSLISCARPIARVCSNIKIDARWSRSLFASISSVLFGRWKTSELFMVSREDNRLRQNWCERYYMGSLWCGEYLWLFHITDTRTTNWSNHALGSADLPSNGFGISYGDAHNSTFHTVLASSPVSLGGRDPSETGTYVHQDDRVFSSNWCLNLGVRQPILLSGTSPSSPNGVKVGSKWKMKTIYWFLIRKKPKTERYLNKQQTIQNIIVADKVADDTEDLKDDDSDESWSLI